MPDEVGGCWYSRIVNDWYATEPPPAADEPDTHTV